MLEIRHEYLTDEFSTRDAYNEIYSTKGILHRDSIYLWLIKLLQPQSGKTLIDIACGEGRLVTLAKNYGLKSIGTDFAIEGVIKGKMESPDAEWFTADGESLPLRDSIADYVTHVGSLEHYLNPEDGAKEIARILKPGGKACILLPNAFGLLGNIHYVLRNGDIFDDGQPLQRYGTRRAWQRILEAAGLEITSVIGYFEITPPQSFVDLIWLFTHPKKLTRFLISHLIPTNLCNDFIYLCTKHE